MRLEWIEDILAVLDTGSFSKAAEIRCRTPSSFTRRIRTIEEALGAQIFDRSKKPAELLGAAKEQEQTMRSMVLALRDLKRDLAASGRPATFNVSFAFQHAISTTVSPRLIKKITQENSISVRVHSANRDACFLMLLSGTVDLAILYGMSEDEGLHNSPALLETTLLEELLIPVAAPGFPLPHNDSTEQVDLPVISYPNDSFLGQQVRRWIYPALLSNYRPRSVVETALTLAVAEYALEGIGLAWLPRSIAKEHIATGRLTSFEHILPTHKLSVTLILLSNNSSKTVLDIWGKLTAVAQLR